MTNKALFLVILFVSNLSYGQFTQTVRGRVTDMQSQSGLPMATIMLLDSDNSVGTTTDIDGYFELPNIPIGRISLSVSYIGYKSATLNNLSLTSGKELVVNVALEETITQMDEIVVRADKDKSVLNNDLVTVSGRSFNIEETSRFAGSLNDPSRMAANFAGVSGANDARNDIIIRGNSPSGLLWRLEGIDIPSPNHFSAIGTTGGPVSILNNNLLAKSDFMTSAFPAQYGNAISGVFDLQMRKGNRNKREYLGQVGFNGFEFGAEGPFKKDGKASYLINYRYSTLGLFEDLGISNASGTGAAIPYYQDISFNVDLPTKKLGRFTWFGIGGKSNIDLLGSNADTTEVDLYGTTYQDIRNRAQMGVTGLKHQYFIDKNTFLKTVIAASHTQEGNIFDTLRITDRMPIPKYRNTFTQNKLSANILFNKKFNARNTVTAGVILDVFDQNLRDSVYTNSRGWITVTEQDGMTTLGQAYAHLQHRFTDKFTLNAGFHYQYFFLNNSSMPEPRLGLNYAIDDRQSLSFGYGLHSQTQPMTLYFVQSQNRTTGEMFETNRDLDFVKSHHLVAGYQRTIGDSWFFKTEAYYQYLYDVAVEQNPSAFSVINVGADFNLPTVDSLVNNGMGYNYGMEFTVEKYYSQGWYMLATLSLFESKYRGSDQILRNTAFNGRYVGNLLAGKEFTLMDGRSNLFLDLRLTNAGGRYVTPIDIEASREASEIRLDHEQAFGEQLSDYFRADVKIGFRLNGKKVTQEWVLNIQNITDHDNVFRYDYNPYSGQEVVDYQQGLFIIPQYRILF